MTMMTRRGKRRDWCCPGHNPKELDHGTERAREKREWSKDAMSEKLDHDPCMECVYDPARER